MGVTQTDDGVLVTADAARNLISAMFRKCGSNEYEATTIATIIARPTTMPR